MYLVDCVYYWYLYISDHWYFRALEKEQEACHKLRQNLYDERNSVQQSDEQMLEDLQVALETEKAVAMDLRGALEHEKQRVASIVATVATERTAMKDNVDQEKAITRKVKHDLDTMQVNTDISHFNTVYLTFRNICRILTEF